MDEVALLAGVPVFAGLPADLLADLARVATPAYLHAGETLFRQGEPGDALYVVQSGRVEVLVDGELVRVHGRGEAFGELALLSGGVRTASVRARRDSELLAVGRAEFERLLTTEPAFSLALVHELARRLRRGDQPPTRRPASIVYALASIQPGLPESAVGRLADLLLAELRRATPATRIDGDAEPDSWPSRLDAAEAAGQSTLLVADRPGTRWWRFCLRQADRTLAVADPALSGPDGVEPVAGCQLVALGTQRLGPWLDRLQPSAHHLVDLGEPADDVARLARRISRRAVGLVLSGGGSRGMAHLGVLDVLHRAGLVIDRIGGTSSGSFVAGLAALGLDPDQMREVVRAELVERRPFNDYTWPRYGLLRGERAQLMLDRVFGAARIEDQPRSLFCVSVDLVRAEEIVHRRGRIAEAVGLSSRLPGVAPPRWVGDRLHTDGGVLDNLPVGVMAADGEGPVVAVDVMRPFQQARGTMPKIVDAISRAMVLASWQRAESGRLLAHTVITPELGQIGMFEFHRLDEIVELGRRAAEKALDGIAGLFRAPAR